MKLLVPGRVLCFPLTVKCCLFVLVPLMCLLQSTTVGTYHRFQNTDVMAMSMWLTQGMQAPVQSAAARSVRPSCNLAFVAILGMATCRIGADKQKQHETARLQTHGR